ncbi:MAG: ATP-binding cassette domain-containing protein [Rhodobiaceae bacterium]
MDAVLQAGERSGKLVVKADKIAKSYGDKKLIDSFSTQIKRGSRIGLIGPNGAGKTTLLNILLGSLRPDSGNIRLGKNLTPLILDQQRQGIKKDWNVKDALTDGAGDLVSVGEETMHVIGYMKNFLFHPAQMRTPVTVLSGGEQARLFLARGLRQPSNLLVMDEPTNDLDLETLDLLQEMIAAYDGTVILVSHDRDFLDRTVTAVFNAEGEGRWVEYAGGYSDMRAQQKGQGYRADHAHRASISKTTTDGQGKRKSSVRKKLSYKHQFRLEKLPKEMEFFELAITEIEDQLTQPDLYSKDPKRFNQLAVRLEEAKNNLKKAEEEWLELEATREELESEEGKGKN